MNQNLDYRIVLADLRARRLKLDTAISAIEGILGESQSPVPTNQTLFTESRHDSVNAAPIGAYAHMTIAAAAIHFLKQAGKAQSTGTIAEALRRGGIPSHSKNLYRTLYNTLNNRLDKEILKDGKKWGLVEWVPK